jgi:hypothetical protein
MSFMTRMASVIILLALAALGASYMSAAHARGVGHFGGHFGYMGHMGPPIGYVPQQSIAPEFNNPGPQLSVPYTGNAVDQFSPLMGAGQPDALGIK